MGKVGLLIANGIDARYARHIPKNLSGIVHRVNADIPHHIDIAFTEGNDPHAFAVGV